jgi:Ser/Thr protein kinase RdoA (MazF antagonist)
MATYVDGLVNYGWKLGRSCHLIGDELAELHEFARKLGLARQWFQGPGKASTPHYDLTEGRRHRAVELGAVELERKAFVQRCREIRARSGYL